MTILLSFIALIVATVALGQARVNSGVPDDPRPFNKKDLTGIWSHSNRGGQECGAECGDRGYSVNVPPMTPEGQKRFDTNKPSYGRPLGQPLNGDHVGRVRAIPPALGNDPQGFCIPQGVPRHLLFPYPVEFMMTTDNRLIQHFEWDANRREIWLDGRKLPAVPVDLPTWYGYSVGRWEGDTFVVDTVGLDERSWVDHFGYPHSEEMRLQERYRRFAYNKLELTMTIDDPRTYTKPWVSDRKVFIRLEPSELKSGDGWSGLLELACADLAEEFNKKVRDPAGGIR